MKRTILGFALLLSCIFAANVSAAPDSTPPTIESIEVLTKEVAPGGKVKIKVTVSDDISGVKSLKLDFNPPSGNSIFSTHYIYLKENDPLENTIIIETEALNSYAEHGVYSLDFVYVSDFAGNYDGYYSKNPDDTATHNISFTVDPNASNEEVEIDDGFKALEPKTDVERNKEFTITFNMNLDIKTLTEGNVYVLDPNGSRVPLMFIVDRGEAGQTSQVTIAPLNNYRSNTTYTLYVKDVRSITGQILEQKTKMKFTTK